MSCAIDPTCTDPTHAYGRSTMPAPELSLTERMLLAHIEAAPAAPESYAPKACPSRSHGPDGWHCAITGEHVMHLNAARTVGWQ